MRCEAKTHASWELTLDEGSPQSIELDARLYFDDLLADLESKLNATGSLDYNVSEDGGVVTISADGQFDVHWDDFALAEALGFDANLDGASSYESPQHADMVHYADHVQTPALAPFTGFPESDMAATIAPTGHVHAMYSTKRRVNRMTIRYSPLRKTLAAAEERAGESFESFWLNWILGEKDGGRPAGPVRVDGGRKYKLADMRSFKPEQERDQFTAFWKIDIPRMVLLP